MKALEGSNNVKVYNLSAGKSLPDWLTERKKRKLVKRDVDIQHRIELIQDFDMPDISGCVKVSPDGQYILATGMYKPRVKCFEVSALSLKFERCFDAEVIQMAVLSEDYSKMVFLQDERFVEFHNQGGRWFRTRIPRFGRDMAYHYPSCDLYLAASGSEVYRLNLNQGRFLNSIQTDCHGINKCVFNPAHYLFMCGSADGRVESWDPRAKTRVGMLDCAIHMACEDIKLPFYKSTKELGITSLAFNNDALTLGVGTYSGKILVYDIRSNKPMLIKDHMDGYPIKNIEFHPSSKMVVSMSCNAVKIWERETGKPHTSIESDVKFNDLCVVPDSGMLFVAAEDPKLQTYFLPSLGPTPKWCGYLDTIIEELEEEEVTQTYDDYKFVTEEELKVLGLDDLIGTSVLRAVMHGYYIDIRLYSKAKMIANPFDYQEFIKQKVKQKIAEKTERKAEKNLPQVNQALFTRLVEDKDGVNVKQSTSAKEVLKDPRFQTMFADESFEIDKESEAFRLMQPILMRGAKSKKKSKKAAEEAAQTGTLKEVDMDDNSSSDSDSIISSGSDGEDSESESEGPSVDSRLSPESEDEPMEEPTTVWKRKKKNIVPDLNAKPLPTSEFISADTIEEMKHKSKKVGRMSLASRLEQTEDDSDDHARVFGSHEMEFIPEGRKDAVSGFDDIKERQRKHRMERKGLIRSGQRIKGNIRMNKPFK